MREWKKVTLGYVTNWRSGGTPRKSIAEYWNGDIPWISANSMIGNRFYTSDLKISQIGLDNGSQIAPKNSILLLVRGSMLHKTIPFGMVMHDIAFNQDVKAVIPNERVYPWFLYAWFHVHKLFLLNNIVELTGHGAGKLDTERLQNIPFFLPSFKEQISIGEFAKALDDKIELNQQMNRTLEAIARAIFKSWFIDFDPVRAKMDGRQPVGMDAETAALFPDEFEDSALGKIPKGWKVGLIEDEFKITMGQSPPSSTYNEELDGLPFYQGCRDFSFRYPSVRVHCNAPTRLASAGDTLVSVRAPVGNINMAKDKCCIGRGIAAARHKEGSRSYTYYTMQALNEYFARFEAEGTVFGSMNKKDFLSIPCIIPPKTIISTFEKMAFSPDQHIENQEQQTSTLTSIRDALLPKLLSGEICVKDAEKILEEVV
ncbi:restriction endonuclease subunit S [Limnospira fusiformis]|uniref:restriction endonuclease subunit S n=1 Tax=Limnospira fusiformis TaxID=54297 RepID=UPI002AA11475|nr:restriction endonuclease subunit S [Limnospira fusiformis LS22]